MTDRTPKALRAKSTTKYSFNFAEARHGIVVRFFSRTEQTTQTSQKACAHCVRRRSLLQLKSPNGFSKKAPHRAERALLALHSQWTRCCLSQAGGILPPHVAPPEKGRQRK